MIHSQPQCGVLQRLHRLVPVLATAFGAIVDCADAGPVKEQRPQRVTVGGHQNGISSSMSSRRDLGLGSGGGSGSPSAIVPSSSSVLITSGIVLSMPASFSAS